ncbi:TetR/AcrR family transcriptional regulator [Amycolatopsis dongchuanensis]|uniref:DNA-binding transcriptional regulator, AcrR family n=3 Tax=Pseudonocardiaceae TaxID=2070 RepID=A0A1I3WP25_9PSEU|nr:DNA-binding transcriptional regulator, AcrR family [Amycolatopsis sacchari]
MIAAALELVSEKGPQGFTMTEAAKRAGVSAAAPYRHFAHKDALLAEVADHGFGLLSTKLDRIAGGHQDPRERLLALARGYVRWAVAHPDYYRVMFVEHGAGELRPAGRRSFLALVGAIEACQTAELIRRQDPLAVAGPMWSLVHGAALLRITGRLRAVGVGENAEELAARSIAALLDSPAIAP